MKRAVVIGAAVLAVAFTVACGDRAAEYQAAVDTLSRRQKDSLLSTMPIPGAGAVGRALGAVDKANARAAQTDSVR